MNDTQRNTNLAAQWVDAWNEFWFRPTQPHTLGVIRILAGLMAIYTFAVWTIEFDGFIGGQLLPQSYRADLYSSPIEAAAAWSHFDWLPATMLLPAHVLGLIVAVCFTIGWQTRIFAPLTALLVISYANRTTGALFGLDQILAFLTIYLAIGNCGGAWSVDRWRKRNKENQRTGDRPNTFNTIATRLIQIHLCVVYLFAGLGKCQGDTWWNGEALWGALASHEYQTVDMTFMADQMWLVAVLTLLTLAWEVSYVALIWPRLTRPIILALAIPMHLGIGICMGMMTFGLIMLVANIAFISPKHFRLTRSVSRSPNAT